MAKLKLKQKEWFTLAEAASYLNLSMESGQPITEIDLLHHAAAGDLMLSVKCFSCIRGAFGYFYPIGSRPPQPETDPPEHNGMVIYLGQYSGPKQNLSHLKFYELLKKMEDDEAEPDPDEIWEGPAIAVVDEDSILPACVWDILPDSSCQTLIEAQLKRCIEQPDEDAFSIVDFREEETSAYEFSLCLIEPSQEGAAYIGLSELVKDSIFCVQPNALEQLFEDSSKPQNPDISTKEKKTYLRVIRALCEEHKDIDLCQHSTAAGQLMAMADTLGLTIPRKRTLENLLKEARDLED